MKFSLYVKFQCGIKSEIQVKNKMSNTQRTTINQFMTAIMKHDIKSLDSLYTEDAREAIERVLSPLEKSQLWAEIIWSGKHVDSAVNAIGTLDTFIGADLLPTWIDSKLVIFRKIDQKRADEIISTLNVIKWVLSKNLLFTVDGKPFDMIDILYSIIDSNHVHIKLFIRYAVIMKMITYEDLLIKEEKEIIKNDILHDMIRDIYSELNMEMTCVSSEVEDE